MDEIRQQVRTDLERQYRRSYRIGFFLMSCLFSALVPYYLLTYPQPMANTVAGVTGVSVLLLLGLLAALKWDRIPPRHYQVMGVLGIGAVLLPLLVQLGLHGPWRLHVEVGLLVLINALAFHTSWYFLGAELVTIGLWLGVCFPILEGGDRINLGIAAVSALVVSFIAHSLVVGLLKSQERLRIQDLTREQEQKRLLTELQRAFEHVQTLRGLVPICAQCKKVRDDRGYWQRVETFVEEHSLAEFTHGLCPDCQGQLEQEFEEVLPAPED
jgi:hypothetical protein